MGGSISSASPPLQRTLAERRSDTSSSTLCDDSALRRSPIRRRSLVLPAFLRTPGLGECRDSGRREPERVDDPKVLKMAFRAGPPNQVLRNVEAGGRLRRSKEGVVDVLPENRLRLADHGLTKLLVLA